MSKFFFLFFFPPDQGNVLFGQDRGCRSFTKRKRKREKEREQSGIQDAFVCLFAVFKTKTAWRWESHQQQTPLETSSIFKGMQMTALRAGAGFILELLNYLISKITCALFMNTVNVGNGSGIFFLFFFFFISHGYTIQSTPTSALALTPKKKKN